MFSFLSYQKVVNDANFGNGLNVRQSRGRIIYGAAVLLHSGTFSAVPIYDVAGQSPLYITKSEEVYYGAFFRQKKQ